MGHFLLPKEANIKMERDRRGMYNRNHPNRGGLKEEFVEGVKGFIAYAKTLSEFCNEGTIRCPCAKCNCIKLLIPEDVKVHLYRKGFRENYYVWTVHGENYSNLADVDFQNLTGCESGTFFENYSNRLSDMLRTARETNGRPTWILDDIWVKLLEY
ncbi:uncharacterized protein [Nicotiana tomentosiformis]|uniref:uncharacterized protein n=1 Tax=Nicotiana tomentosiformis TaxID=4098 RepID=UPI00388C4A82